MSKLPYISMPAMLRISTAKYAERPAISYKKGGEIITLTYTEFYQRVLMAARGLRRAGMSPGDRVAIFSENRAGWAISDFGVQAALGITVPIYATNTGEQAAYIINHSGARIVLHMLQLLKRENAKRGMASICIGGGQCAALLIERT